VGRLGNRIDDALGYALRLHHDAAEDHGARNASREGEDPSPIHVRLSKRRV
jgi:hypothetical protein